MQGFFGTFFEVFQNTFLVKHLWGDQFYPFGSVKLSLQQFPFFVLFLVLHYCHLSTFFALVTFNSADIVEKYSTKKMLFCKYAMLNITKICEKKLQVCNTFSDKLQLFWIIFEHLFFRTPYDGCFCEFLLALNIQSKTSKQTKGKQSTT